MNKNIDLINDLIRRTQTQIDDIQWENQEDPRIEVLLQELNYYKEQEENGIIYEPRF